MLLLCFAVTRTDTAVTQLFYFIFLYFVFYFSELLLAAAKTKTVVSSSD